MTPLFSRYLLSRKLSKYTSCTAVDHTSVCTRRVRTVGESSSSQLTRLSCCYGTSRRSSTDSVCVGGRRLGVRGRDQLVRAARAFQKRARTQKFEGTLLPQGLKMGAILQTQYAYWRRASILKSCYSRRVMFRRDDLPNSRQKFE